MENRRKKEIVVFDGNVGYCVPETIKEFREYWEEKINRIPSQYRNSARILLEPGFEFRTPCMILKISYARLETKEEFEKRILLEHTRQKEVESRELRLLEKLKTKYGESS